MAWSLSMVAQEEPKENLSKIHHLGGNQTTSR
jgi:hypothetical protein